MSHLWNYKRFIKRRLDSLVRPLRRPWMRAEDLSQGMEGLGIDIRRPILIHSSLSACGYVPGGVQTILSAISTYMGSESLITMPAHSWHQVSKGLREFDVRTTPSCVGAISEAFRIVTSVERSLHPTHSLAALGKNSAEFLRGHEQASEPCGAGSPYHTLLLSNATVFFLGAGFDSNTSYHCVEALCKVPYLLLEEPDEFVLVDREGVRTNAIIRRHRPGVRRNLTRLLKALSAAGILKSSQIRGTPCMAFDGKDFLDFLSERLKSDVHYLL